MNILLELKDAGLSLDVTLEKFEGLEISNSHLIEDFFEGKQPQTQEDFILIGRTYHEMKLRVEQINDLLRLYNKYLEKNVKDIEKLIDLISDQQNKDEAE